MWNFVLVFGLSLALSLLLTPPVRNLALRIGFVDIPVERSMHKEPKPYLGGVAIFLAFVVGVAAGGGFADREVAGLVLGGLLVVLLGIVDDRVRLRPWAKLLGQVVAAAVLVYGFQVEISSIYSPLGDRYLQFGYWAGPLTIFWLVAFTNVVNLVDGLDGLAAGISSIAAVTLLIVAIMNRFTSAAVVTAALAGAAIGFLKYNFNPAKIFMGDAGSMFLGYTLGGISVYGMMKTTAAVSVLVPILALGLPIMDTAFAIVRRLASGRPIGQADKDHLHHRLLRLGLSHRAAVLVMWAISAWLGLSAVAVSGVSASEALIIAGVVFAAMIWGAGKMGLLRLTEEDSRHNTTKGTTMGPGRN